MDGGKGDDGLGTLPGDTTSEARDINDAGHVVGSSSAPVRNRAFRWTASTGMVSLDSLPDGQNSRAFGINNAGRIVGTSTSAAGSRAVLWTAAGVIRDLNDLIPSIFELTLSDAHAINKIGQIVALSGGGEHADDRDHNDHFYHVFLLNP